METGLYYDLDFKEYRAHTQWISISELNTYRKAPLIYKHEYIDGNKRQASPAQAIGTALHAAYLEPTVWQEKFKIAEKIDRRTKEGKIAGERQDAMARIEGVTFLNPDQYNMVENACYELDSHPYLKTIKEGFKFEASMFWVDGDTNCKGRVDSFSPSLSTIFDVKTTKDAKNFGKSILEYGYHRQAAYYLDGLTQVTGQVYEDFVWIVVEMEAPFLHAVYKADKDMLSIGRMEYKQDLLQFQESKVKNEWPGLSPLVQTISLPSWYVSKTVETKL